MLISKIYHTHGLRSLVTDNGRVRTVFYGSGSGSVRVILLFQGSGSGSVRVILLLQGSGSVRGSVRVRVTLVYIRHIMNTHIFFPHSHHLPNSNIYHDADSAASR